MEFSMQFKTVLSKIRQFSHRFIRKYGKGFMTLAGVATIVMLACKQSALASFMPLL